jgi:hypothetical protein
VGAKAYPVGWDGEPLANGPVLLEAGSGELVARGFGGQRLSIPSGEIGAIKVTSAHQDFRWKDTDFLSVVDRDGRVLLRAYDAWDDRAASERVPDDNAEPALRSVCRQLDLPYPEYLDRAATRREEARWRKAPGYCRLRTQPVSWVTELLTAEATWGFLALTLGGLCAAAGVGVAVLLPASVGTVDPFIGLVLVVAAMWATGLFFALGPYARNWAEECANRGTIVPVRPFFTIEPHVPRDAAATLKILMVLSIPFLVIYGPFVGLTSLAHGFDDRAIVSELRQHGATTTGTITPDTDFTTASETLWFWLEFTTPGGQRVKTKDPGINGWTWPVTNPHVEVVYLPSDPDEAAVAGQLDGSPWRGAVTGNLISGALLTVALVSLTWWAIRKAWVRWKA